MLLLMRSHFPVILLMHMLIEDYSQPLKARFFRKPLDAISTKEKWTLSRSI